MVGKGGSCNGSDRGHRRKYAILVKFVFAQQVHSTAMKFFFLVLLAVSPLALAGEDYYDILGIGKDADNRQIRKVTFVQVAKKGNLKLDLVLQAFKKLALKYHPDKSDEKDAQEKFLKINKAYETLKDEDKRKRYDR